MKKFSLIAVTLLFMVSGLFAQTWTLQTSPVTTALLSVSAVNRQVCWMSGLSGRVVRTTNGGTTWTSPNTGLTDGLYSIFALDENNCWIGADDGSLYRTTNGGANWTLVPLSPIILFVNIIHFFDANYGFVQGDPNSNQWRYYITTNGGANWTLPPNTPASVGTEAGWNNCYAAIDTGHIWWGTNATKIWKGSLRGQFTSYPTIGLNSFGIWFNDVTTGIALMTSGTPFPSTAINKSVNGGLNWTSTSYIPGGTTNYSARGVRGTGFVWICTTTGIYRSTDNGTTFALQYTSTSPVYHLDFVDQGRGWSCRANGGILIYNDPNYTGIGSGNNELPHDYKLEQNYPNPFNPQTTIDFTLAKTGYVTLKIYNLIGQEVMTLINGVETAGKHNVFFNAANLPSGTYFYAMKSGEFTETKSMVLVK